MPSGEEGADGIVPYIIFFFLQDFDNIEDIATDEELDMLDLAFGLTDTSRLGCQVANCSA